MADGGSFSYAGGGGSRSSEALIAKFESELKGLFGTMNRFAEGAKFQDFWKNQDEMVNDVIRSYQKFNKTLSNIDAEKLINATNALKGLAQLKGFDFASSLGKEFDSVMKVVSKAEGQLGTKIIGQYSPSLFADAFKFLDVLDQMGLSAKELGEKLSTVDTGGLRRQLSAVKEELREVNEENATLQGRLNKFESGGAAAVFKEDIKRLEAEKEALRDEKESLEEEIESVRDKAQKEFRIFLRGHGISDTDQYGDDRFQDYFNNIANGWDTSAQAIRRFKVEYASLFEGENIGAEQVEQFASRLEDLFVKVEELSTKISTLGSGGGGNVTLDDSVLDKLTERLSQSEALTDKEREAVAALAGTGGEIKSVYDIIIALVNALDTGSDKAKETADSLGGILNNLKEISMVGEDSLRYLGVAFERLQGLNGFEVKTNNFVQLTDALEKMMDAIKQPERLSILSGLDFTKLSNLKFTKTYEHLAANLPAISEVNVDNLVKLSNVNFQNLAGVTFKKSNIEALASLANVVQGLETLQTKVDEIQGRLAPTEPILEPIATDDYVEPLEKAIEEVTQKTEEAAERRIEAEKRVAEATKQMAAEKEQITESSGAAQEAVANAQELAESQRQIGISAQETKDQVTNAAQAEVEAIKEVTAAAKEQGRAADIAAKSMMMPGGFSQESINEIKEELIGKNVGSEQADRIANDFKNIRGEITKTKATVLDTANHTEKVVNVTIEAVEKLESGLKRITTKSTDYKFNKKDNDWERTDKEVVTLDYNGTRVDATPTADNAKATAEALKKASAAMAELIQNETKFTGIKEATNQAQYLNHEMEKGKEEVELYVQRYQELAEVSRMEAMQTIVGQSNVTKAIQARGASMATLQDKWEAEKVKVQEVYDKLTEMRDAAKAMASDENSGPTGRYKLPEFVSYLDTIEKMLPDVAELLKKTFRASDAPEVFEMFTNIVAKMRDVKKAKKDSDAAMSKYDKQAAKDELNDLAAKKKLIEDTTKEIIKLEGEAAHYDILSKKPGISQEEADTWSTNAAERQAQADALIKKLEELRGVSAREVQRSLATAKNASANYRKYGEDLIRVEDEKTKKIEQQKSALAKLNNQLEQYIKTMKRAGAAPEKIGEAEGLIAHNNNLIDRLKTGNVLPDEEIQKAASSMEGFTAASKAAGDAQETLGHQIMRVFSQKFGYAVIATLAMQVRKAIRQIYTNVVELDTAMTELRKVTDETAASYERFLENAAQGAQKLGVSMTELVNATADFARLGYNIVDANTLAEVATVYKNVGDGITSIDEASSSIISTMKAFKMEASDAMLIVDKFNHTGKMSCPAA